MLRALDPTLTQFGVTGVLADAYLELRDGNGNLVEANNDWQQNPESRHNQGGWQSALKREGVGHGLDT